MARVAFIGLGNMGGGMAANLVKAGHEVVAFDLAEPAIERARGNGASIAASTAEAVEGAEAVVTMLPALVVVAVGVDPSRALVLSQVVLSFGIPFALIPLILFCRDRRLMGSLVNRRATTAAAVLVASVIIALNVFLLAGTFGLVDV